VADGRTWSADRVIIAVGGTDLAVSAYSQHSSLAFQAALCLRDKASQLLSATVGGLPPTLIQVGSAETLLADATRFAEAAGAAEVPVTLEIWPQMIHAWPVWNAHLEPGRRALASAGVFIRSRLAA